jgi:hypothetical protein
LKYRVIDAGGDYCFGKSMQDFVTDNDAIAQAVGTNLRLLKGEWWEDVSDGLPLFQSIIAKNGSKEQINVSDMLVKDRILLTTGVREIVSFSSALVNRVYSVNCSIKTILNVVVSVEVMF